jgi:tetratricopeptide (TPR) repeat protein
MRGMLIGLTILGGWLLTASFTRAGVYNLDPPPSNYPSDFIQAHTLDPVNTALMHLGELRAIDDRAASGRQVESTSLRALYVRQATDLQGKQRQEGLGPVEHLDLGACLIRLGRWNEATAVLEEALRLAPPSDPRRFLLQLELASAYQEDDNLLQRAIDTQRQALAAWPAVWAGWGEAEARWYRRVEQFALAMMQSRHRESLLYRGRPPLAQTVDPLFPRVRFVGPSGQYEAGGIDFAMWNELPGDAESVVLQLLLWRPHDNRLYWLYGELLNARGQVDAAALVLRDLVVNRQARYDELMQHYRILKSAAPLAEALKERRTRAALLWTTAPRGQFAAAGVGPLAQEMGWAAVFIQAGEDRDGVPPPPPSTLAATTTPPRGDWLPDWRTIAVSFVAGVLVAWLVGLQWREWGRRRKTTAVTPNGVANSFASPANKNPDPSGYSRPVGG